MLKNSYSSYPRNLNIGYISAQSLCPSNSNSKLEEFKSTFSSSGLHIIGVSETWFKPGILSQALSLTNYKLIRNARPGNTNIHPKRADCVCMYISNNLQYKVILRGKQFDICESLFVEVFGSGCSILVGVVYLPSGR